MGRETVDSVFEGLTAVVGVMREVAQEDPCDGDGPGTDREQASPSVLWSVWAHQRHLVSTHTR